MGLLGNNEINRVVLSLRRISKWKKNELLYLVQQDQ